MRALTALLTVGAVLVSAPICAQEIDWQQVDATLGRKPASWAMFIVTVFHEPIFR